MSSTFQVIEPGSISEWIWESKYRLKSADGQPIDKTVDDTFRRVATAIAGAERTDADRLFWYDRFYNAIHDFEFLPAGRILAGAGADRAVTLCNCFVMGTIPDSMTGIMQALSDAAMTMRAGGGVGMDFSTLRPKGAPVLALGADASGPVSFMEMWDSMCRTIMSAGARRGAMMAVMRCDHPDIEDFITAKRTAGRLTNFNVSVLVTDDFMRAVDLDAGWDLVFDGKVYRSMQARALWRLILKSTYEHSEPGVIFIDRVNAQNPLQDIETIAASNPCVSGDTLLLTRSGNVPIRNIVGQSVDVWNGEEWSTVEPYITGTDQPLMRVTMSNGLHVDCTPAHKFIMSDGSRKIAGELAVGDAIVKSSRPVLDDPLAMEYSLAWEQGFFSGDGHIDGEGRPWVYLYGEKENLAPAFDAIKTSKIEKRTLIRLKRHLGKTFVPDEAWNASSRLAWFAGLCDSDGSAQRTDHGIAVQVSSINRAFLVRTALMLQGLGVQAVVALSHEARTKLLPDGTGGARMYDCADCYRLQVSAWDVATLQHKGFKPRRLDLHNNAPTRSAARFIRVTAVDVLPGTHTTYCITEPKRHAAVFNGILTGQCGEQMLPPHGACVLGSINLTRLVQGPFTPSAALNLNRLAELSRVAVRFLDNVISVGCFPLREQVREALDKRRIGIGITGLADALIMLGERYGSARAIAITKNVLEIIDKNSLEASIELATERAPYLLWQENQGPRRRNSHLMSIAPTGTISLFAGNISSGIEPVFAFSAMRSVLMPDGSKRKFTVEDYARRLQHSGAALYFDNDPWRTTADLSIDDHLNMAAAAQEHVDSAISKTINCPPETTFDQFAEVYRKAYALGMKGCTTYRPSASRGAVLEAAAPETPSASPAPKPQQEAGNVVRITDRLERSRVIAGCTYKIKHAGAEHALYVTINDVTIDGRRRPFEVFFNSKDVDGYAWRVALSRMVSAVFRKGGDVAFVAAELKAVFDPRGGYWEGGKFVPSIAAAIGAAIEEHMRDLGLIDAEPRLEPGEKLNLAPAGAKHCPKCQTGALHRSEGCWQCTNCDYSKC